MNATIREVGGAVGVAVIVAVFQAAGGTLTPDGFAQGLRPAAFVGATVVALGAAVAARMPRATGRITREAPTRATALADDADQAEPRDEPAPALAGR